MIYLKTYCYSEHEIDFIKAQLIESDGYVDKIIIYEYNVTHRGEQKPYRLSTLIDAIEPRLRSRLLYRPVDIKEISIKTDSPEIIHSNNEPIQRSYFFNDTLIKPMPDDIIFDVDIDEIIYRNCYPWLIKASKILNMPFSIKLNQFFYQENLLWKDAGFKSPAVYKYNSAMKRSIRLGNNFTIAHQRDLKIFTPRACGAHLSWVMPIDMMVRKLKSYSHPEYEKFADESVLYDAIRNKKYIFDPSRPFNVAELKKNDKRIPIFFRKNP
jgi:hypothetical protein